MFKQSAGINATHMVRRQAKLMLHTNIDNIPDATILVSEVVVFVVVLLTHSHFRQVLVTLIVVLTLPEHESQHRCRGID
jgi:hypothetical protein